VHLVREASILGCFGQQVFAQLCHQPELSGKLTAALEDAKIQTVHYGVLGPVPDQAEVADLQSVLRPVAPSIQVLAIKGRSARFVISLPDLPGLQTVNNLEPNTSLRIRVPDINGKWRCLNPPNLTNPSTDSISVPEIKSTPPGYVPQGSVTKLASHAPHGLAPDTQRGDIQVNIVPSPVSNTPAEQAPSSVEKSSCTETTAAQDRRQGPFKHKFCWLCGDRKHTMKECQHYKPSISCRLCSDDFDKNSESSRHYKKNCPLSSKTCRQCGGPNHPNWCRCAAWYFKPDYGANRSTTNT
jgi:hypothetical protein